MGRSRRGHRFVHLFLLVIIFGSVLIQPAGPLAPQPLLAAEALIEESGDPVELTPIDIEPTTPTSVCPSDPTDPNDSQAAATPLTLGLYQDHSICAPGDADWFAFDAQANATYRAEAYNAWPDITLDMAIVDAQGTVLATGAFDNGNISITFTPAVAGTYYAHVTHANATAGNPSMRYRILVYPTVCTDPTEPQSTSATASTLGLGVPVRAAFCTSGDPDWFKVAVTPGALYDVHYTDAGPLTYATLRMYASDNLTTPLASSYTATKTQPDLHVAFTAPATGLVYIRLDGNSVTQARTSLYTLQVTAATCSDSAQEPDNTTNPAMVLSTTPQQRNLCVYGDEDWFTLNAQQGTTYRIETAADNGAFAPEVTILPLGSLAAKATGTTGLVQWTADATGPLRVRVRPASSLMLHSGMGYSIQLAPPRACTDPSEPANDTTAGATVLTDVPSVVQSLCSSLTTNDADWFVFTPTTTGAHTFAFTSTAAIAYASATVYAADATTYLGSVDSNPARKELTLTLTANQPYYIKVQSSITGRNDAAYTYALAVAPRSSYFDPTEPNNSSGAAAPLTLGLPIEGQFRTSSDHDYYSLPVIAGTAYRVTVEPLSAGVFPSISINSASPVADLGRPLGEAVFVAQNTGTELVHLTNLRNQGDATFSYRLLAEELAPDPDVPAETPEDAQVLVADTTYTRHLQRPYETEWLTWDAWAGQTYTVTMHKNTSALEWGWSLYDHNLERMWLRNRDRVIVDADTIEFYVQPAHSGPVFLKMENTASARTAGEYTIGFVDDPHVPDPLIPASQENHITAAAVEPSAYEQELRAQANAERIERGLFPLTDSPELRVAARLQAVHMQETGTLTHTWDDGTEYRERAMVAGYPGWLSVQEDATGPILGGQSPVALWMNSMPHRRALLGPSHRDMGLGGSEDGAWWALEMGMTADVYPILINDDAVTTTTSLVSVTLAPVPVHETNWEYQLSNTPTFADAVWMPYPMVTHVYTDISYLEPIEATVPHSVTWELLPGGGNQTVYARYRHDGADPLPIMTDRIRVQLPPVLDPTQPPLPVAMIAPMDAEDYGAATEQVPLLLGGGTMSPQWLKLQLISTLTELEQGRQSSIVGSGADLSVPAIVRLPDPTPTNSDDDGYALLWDSQVWRLVRDWSMPGKVWQLERSSDTNAGIRSWDLRITELTGAGHSLENGRFWSMRDRTGLTWVFGATADSAWRWVDSAGAVHGWRWNLTQQRDMFGNAQTWTYATETAQAQGQTYDRAGHPVSVTWNGNPAAGVVATHRADFTYEARGVNDATAGAMFFTSLRLKQIDFQINNTSIRTFDLTYQVPNDPQRAQLLLTGVVDQRPGSPDPKTTMTFTYHAPLAEGEGRHLLASQLNDTLVVAYNYTRTLQSNNVALYERHYTVQRPTLADMDQLLALSTLSRNGLADEMPCGADPEPQPEVEQQSVWTELLNARKKCATTIDEPFHHNWDPQPAQETTVKTCEGDGQFTKQREQEPYTGEPYKGGCDTAAGENRALSLNQAYCFKHVNNLEAVGLSSGETRVQVPATFQDIRRADGSFAHHQTSYTYDTAGHPLYVDTLGDIDVAGDESYVAYTYGNPQFSDLITEKREYNADGVLQAQTTMTYLPGTRLVAEVGRWLLEEQRVLTTTYTYNARGWLEQEISPLGAETTYDYDDLGNMVSMIDALGYETTLDYDDHGRIEQRRTPDGATTVNQYNADGTLHAVTNPLQHTTYYGYDEFGRRTTEINARNAVTTTEYNAYNQVAAITNPLSATTRYEYGRGGHTTKVIDPLDYVTTADYDAAHGWQTASTDALSRTTTVAYDGIGRPAVVVDPLLGTTTTEYDGSGHVLRQTDPLGATTWYAYDQFGNVISQTNALSQTTLYAYDSLQRMVVMTDTLQQATHYFYDDDGRQIKVVAPNTGVTLTEYDDLGHPLTVTNALSATTLYAYDEMGRVLTETDPLSNVTTWEYNLGGQVVAMTDTLGLTTHYAYDEVGNTVAVTDTLGYVTTSVYDAANQRIQTIDPLGRMTSYGYDAVGNTVAITDPTGALTTMTPDAVGQIVAVQNPLGTTATTAYDAAGNVVALTSTLGITSTTEYDLNHHPITVTDGLGRQTINAYDELGRKIRTTDPTGVTTAYLYDDAGRLIMVIENVQPSLPASNDVNVTTSYTYDAGGNLHTVTDANGHVTVMEYDLLGQQTRYTDPLSRTTIMTYTVRGELAAMQDPLGQVTAYAYDDGGRLTAIDYAGTTPDTTYVYDDGGRLTKMTDGNGMTKYEYDAVGRMLSMKDAQDNLLAYSYDAVHSAPTEIFYGDQSSVQYTYDDLERIATLTMPDGQVSTFFYHGDTNLPAQISRGILKSEYTYTAANEVALLNHSRLEGGMRQIWRNRQSYAYTYDLRDAVVAVTETLAVLPAPVTTQSTFDPLNRLDTIAYPALPGLAAQALDYSLDAAGNRLDDTLTQYSYDVADQINGMLYDANGNLLNDGTTTYTYDAANRLIGTVSPTGTTAYAYNGHGTLVRETVTIGGNVTTTDFVWDERGELPRLMQSIKSDGTLEQYIYGPEGVHAQYSPDGLGSGTTLYTLLDRQGSIRGLEYLPTKTSAETVYDAWGNQRWHTGTLHSRLGYTGELANPVDGTIYLRARHYLPALGRFLQRDSFQGLIETPQTLHKYAYAHNNPLKYTDPSGHLIPLLLGIWAVVEVGLSIYDTYETVDTLIDPCASGWQKGATVILWLGGLLLPGGGAVGAEKAAVKTAGRYADNVDEVAEVVYYADEILEYGDEVVGYADDGIDALGKADDALVHVDDIDNVDDLNHLDDLDDVDNLDNLDDLDNLDNIPCTTNSFAAGTLVATPQGLVPIETLLPGDNVWAVDPETGAEGYFPLSWTTHHTTEALVVLEVMDADQHTETISTTDAHPFWVLDRGWIDAGDLVPGDVVQQASGGYAVVVDTVVTIQPVEVYNVTVETLHTYTVGRFGSITHNVSKKNLCVTIPNPNNVDWSAFQGQNFKRTEFTDTKELARASQTQQQKFVSAMNKMSNGTSPGVKRLNPPKILANGEKYLYELKIGGSGGRMFGEINEQGILEWVRYDPAHKK